MTFVNKRTEMNERTTNQTEKKPMYNKLFVEFYERKYYEIYNEKERYIH